MINRREFNELIVERSRELDALEVKNNAKLISNPEIAKAIKLCRSEILTFGVRVNELIDSRVIHGEYITSPKCDVCKTPLSHEWLAGDYTMLICSNPECLHEYEKKKKD